MENTSRKYIIITEASIPSNYVVVRECDATIIAEVRGSLDERVGVGVSPRRAAESSTLQWAMALLILKWRKFTHLRH